MALHVFVAMPYGTKEGIDFNRVYSDLIRPALEAEGFEVFRADEEERAGDIRADMFQELLLADVVVADLSIDNPNVWYELGVRHALRARGVIPIACRQGPMPFDVYTDRKLRYRVKDGAPDAAHLADDRAALARMVKETVAAWHGRTDSPVYHLLPFLDEPDWKTLRVGGVREVWEKFADWARRVETARAKQRAGDVVLLAEEAPAQALRREAHAIAAKTLRHLNQPAFALEQIDRALGLDPADLTSRQERGILLGRLGRYEEAKEWLQSVARDHPEDAETCGLLGRVDKEAWVSSWRKPGAAPETLRAEAALEIAQLDEAVRAYLAGFRHDPRHYYSGINACTLMHLAHHLAGEDTGAPRAEVEGGVRWAVRSALSRETHDNRNFWARVTLAELELLVSEKRAVEKAYAHAIAAAENDVFALESVRQQLELMQAVGFRPAETSAAMAAVQRALARLAPPWRAEKVFLFSGHMIDAPQRGTPRFPRAMSDLAAEAIARKLDELGAGADSLGLCEGACGGDLLFAEAGLARGMRLELRLPFAEPEFLERSVAFAGPAWVERYYRVKSAPQTQVLVMPDELGPTLPDRDPFERANLWQLYTALSHGAERVRFIALWNGEQSGKPGGTDHMIEAVRKRSGRVYVIDAGSLLRETKDMAERRDP